MIVQEFFVLWETATTVKLYHSSQGTLWPQMDVLVISGTLDLATGLAQRIARQKQKIFQNQLLESLQPSVAASL
ncbi:MAG: hypothetical protein HC924_07170 [Synechococcaceae cyanobacterium SM2_3_2]|nr:hypothetical protein [Synechococcaceae cyanobacterium SM2_3_2]